MAAAVLEGPGLQTGPEEPALQCLSPGCAGARATPVGAVVGVLPVALEPAGWQQCDIRRPA
jgi:hypothetical protein